MFNTESRMIKPLLSLPEQFATIAATVVRAVHERSTVPKKTKRTPALPLPGATLDVMHDIAQIIDRAEKPTPAHRRGAAL